MGTYAIAIIAALTIVGIIIRPFKLPEFASAVAGAAALLIFGLLSPAEALAGVLKGSDVYLFLLGMMLLAETARREKLFDWLASHALKSAKGSPVKLFVLIYLVGIFVTAFLSNDATAVVLTPAVASAVKTAEAKKPLPYLFICAFIANAASFILPISNPANLVIYSSHMPPLTEWLPQYIVPSLVAVVSTFFLLMFSQRKSFKQKIAAAIEIPSLSPGGKITLWSIICTAVILMISSALGIDLGLPAAITGIAVALLVTVIGKKKLKMLISEVSWSVLPLVAGLFVIVEALNKTGMTEKLTALLNAHAAASPQSTVWSSGLITAFACNIMNNLPAGLIAGNVMHSAVVPESVRSAVLVGIDLGPNLSVTGSLATILWLVALRREGISISGFRFLKTGLLVMTVALLLTLASLFIFG